MSFFIMCVRASHHRSFNAKIDAINFGKNGTRLSKYEVKDFSRILY